MTTALLAIAVIAACIYLTVLALLTVLQRRFLYGPDTARPDISAAAIPEARELTVQTADGLNLLAWWVPTNSAIQPVVLYLHGNAGHIGNRAHRMVRLNSFGWGALLLEYRGYGGNSGTPTEAGMIQDARAAYAALRDMGIPAERIVLYGESLGTGLAVRLATEMPVGAIILESPYTSIVAIGQQKFPYVPVAWLLRDRFDLIGRIGTIAAPVLVMTGGRDTIVAPTMGHAVFAAAPGPKTFWLAPDAGHNDLIAAGAFDEVLAFVRQHVLTATVVDIP